MRQTIRGFGVAVVIAIGTIGLASPAAAQQYCATQVDGARCGAPTHDVINLNSVCKGGECVPEYQDACDGVVCRAGNECLLGACVPSSCDTTTCTALDQCHEAGVCIPPGTCTNPVKLDGSACDDGNAATTGDRCVAGVCTGDPAGGLCSGVVCGAPAECSLQGACDPATGSCTTPPAPRGSTCAFAGGCDGSGGCIGPDFCADFGVPEPCQSFPPVCTFVGRCDQFHFCPFSATPAGSECDDGDPTTVDDVCDGTNDAGNCAGVPAEQYCETQADGAPCGFNPADIFERNSICKAGECVVEFLDKCDGVVCGPGHECLLGDCVPSTCDTVTCTALDQCHAAGVCIPPGTCTNPVKLDGATCDDGDPATTDDRCVSGVCAGDPASNLCSGVVCGAPGECFLQGTCDPVTGSCTTPPAPRYAACSGVAGCDGSGVCVASDFCVDFGITDCTPSPDVCVFSGRCDPDSFCATDNIDVPAGTECDDGDPATVGDVCDGTGGAGSCMGMILNPTEPLELTRAMIWARSRGKVRLEGTAPTIDTSVSLTMTVMDGLGLTVVGTIGPDDCRTRASSGRTKCLFRDPVEKRKKVRLALNPSKAGPGLVDFKIFMNKIDAAQPLDGPVMLTIEENGGTTYEGSIATCQMQSLKLKCS